MPARALSIWVLAIACAAASAQQTPEDLVARERARSAVEEALQVLFTPAPNADVLVARTMDAVDRLEAIGPDVIPFLATEMEQAQPRTFDFCAFALGRFDDPEAEAALRRVVAAAEEDPSSWAVSRKAKAAWALGLQGREDAIEILASGKVDADAYPVHAEMSVLEAVALQLGSRAIPGLRRSIERFAAASDNRELARVSWPLRALRRIGDPAAAPTVIALLEHPEPGVRREAAWALWTLGTPEAVEALLARLDDEQPSVRQAAARALNAIAPSLETKRILERIDGQQDAITRGMLYGVLAKSAGARSIDALRGYWERFPGIDRDLLVRALDGLEGRKVVRLLRDALHERSTAAGIEAAHLLGRMRSADAVEALVSGIDAPLEPMLLASLDEIARLRVARAAPAVGAKLEALLAQPVTDTSQTTLLEHLADTLVALDYRDTEALARHARDGAQPRWIRDLLGARLRQLELLEQNARAPEKWLGTARGPEPSQRKLAYRVLGRIATAEAVRGLVALFDDASVDERVEILRALAESGAREAAPLVERVLRTEPFDPVEQRPVREMAAWAARRIGGSAMFETLTAAVERRRGREPRVTLYAALLGRSQALPLLRSVRRSQLRYIGWQRGAEQERLDTIAREIERGASLARFERPPDELPRF